MLIISFLCLNVKFSGATKVIYKSRMDGKIPMFKIQIPKNKKRSAVRNQQVLFVRSSNTGHYSDCRASLAMAVILTKDTLYGKVS